MTIDDADCLLKQATFEDYPHNVTVLSKVKENIEKTYLQTKFSDEDFVANLYKNDTDNDWFLAQCQSICNQIEKIINPESIYNKYYTNILSDNDKVRLSQELIFDVYDLEKISQKVIINDGSVYRPNYLPSHQFFLHAKFSYFDKPQIAETTNRNFRFSSMPNLIRQAIELKVKYMIGLKKVTKKNGDFKLIAISKILEFCNTNSRFFEMPVPFKTLQAINIWTNSFVHTGITLFCWQSLEAIDLIEPLFSIKNNNSLHIHGFSYLAENISLSDIEQALNADTNLNAKFSLDESYIEGTFLHPQPTQT